MGNEGKRTENSDSRVRLSVENWSFAMFWIRIQRYTNKAMSENDVVSTSKKH